MLEFFGWAGSILFALCGMPQAYQSYKQGHSRGLNWAFILMWGMGEIMTFIYVLPKMDIPLLFNYTINMAFLIVIIYFKIWERKTKIVNKNFLIPYWKEINSL